MKSHLSLPVYQDKVATGLHRKLRTSETNSAATSTVHMEKLKVRLPEHWICAPVNKTYYYHVNRMSAEHNYYLSLLTYLLTILITQSQPRVSMVETVTGSTSGENILI